MPVEPSDPLSLWLQDQLGHHLQARTPVGGGCIHRAWCLELVGGGRVFAKTNTAARLPQLAAEVQGLRQLAAHAPPELLIPLPLALGVAGDQAVLVLPWCDLVGLNGGGEAAAAAARLGQALATLHRASGARAPKQGFGAPAHNFIGAAPQLNGWRQDWGTFFAECRLAPQLAWAARRGEPLRGAQALLERVPRWLAGPCGGAVLVHGDLWCGNAGLLADGRGVLFDPACYWGDREVDLAMAQLFGGFPPAFFEGYDRTWPLETGAAQRVALYNLYHLLNHANLFGGGYGRRAQACLDTLLA